MGISGKITGKMGRHGWLARADQLGRAAGVALFAMAIGACSAAPPGRVEPASPVTAMPVRRAKVPSRYLYVAQLKGPIAVYSLDGKQVRRILRRQTASALAIDPWGDLYATTGDPSGYIGIVAYTAGGAKTFLKLPYWADALTFDASGNLWAANISVVYEVAARGRKVLRTLYSTRGARALTFDRHGNLYVARSGASSSQPSSVLFYPPNASGPSREITDGIDVPDAVRIDASGDLVVANCPSCYASRSGPKGSVTLYAPNHNRPFRTIKDGIDSPRAFALGRNGLLFVANFPYTARGRGSSVSVYDSDGSLLRTITNGIFLPQSLAVDNDGLLYVANCRGCVGRGSDSVTVYNADGTKLLRTVTKGTKELTTIAVGGT